MKTTLRRTLGSASALALCISGCGLPQDAPPADDENLATLTQGLSGPAPQLTSVTPSVGSAVGGSKLTLTGRNFRPGAVVTFDGVPATEVTVLSKTQLTLTLPAKPGALGHVPVKISHPDGKSTARSDVFYYYSDKVAFQASYRLAAGATISQLNRADVNGDGKLDLIVGDAEHSTLLVLLNGGNGIFQDAKVTALPKVPQAVATADFDGDGKQDIVVAQQGTTELLIYPGVGDGTFKAAVAVAGVAGTSIVVGLSATDVNGDSSPDLLFLTNDLVGNSTLFAFTNTKKADFTFNTPFSRIGIGARYFGIADVTGDGKPDMVKITEDSGGPYIFVYPGAGDGTFNDTLSSNVPTGTADLALADVNGDGKTDAVIARSGFGPSGIGVLFGSATGFSSLSAVTSGGPMRTLVVGDVNADGKLDVLAQDGSGPITLLPGNGDGSFQAPKSASSRTVSLMTLADFDGDSKPDLVAALRSVLPDHGLVVQLGDNTGTFRDAGTLTTGTAPSAVKLVDVNGDGRNDAIFASYDSGQLTVQLGDGAGSFTTAGTFAVGKGPSSIEVADVSDDGKVDLVVTNYDGASVSVLLGKGGGSFEAARNFATGNSPSGVAVGDTNADGKLDLIVSNFDSASVSVLLGSGGGSFGVAKTYAVQQSPAAVATADLNADGKADIVVANSDSNSVSVLLATTTGFAAAKNLAVGKSPQSLTLGDFNADGKLDFATANSDDGSVSVALGSGTGNFASATTLAACAFPNQVLAGDVNRDGKLDLAISCDGAYTVALQLGFGDGAFFPAQATLAKPGSGGIALGDVNNDSKLDLLALSESRGVAILLLNRTP